MGISGTKIARNLILAPFESSGEADSNGMLLDDDRQRRDEALWVEIGRCETGISAQKLGSHVIPSLFDRARDADSNDAMHEDTALKGSDYWLRLYLHRCEE